MRSKKFVKRCLTAQIVLVVVLTTVGVAAAQESPYTDMTQREIKGMSPEQTRSYLEGHGMGMALPGELNGYPGPKHVLELREELGLSVEQLAQVQGFFDSMHEQALGLGREIVEREAALDELFSAGGIDETTLAGLTEEIGRLNGRLRGVHLQAHLETTRVLSPHQRQLYSELRGYDEATAGEHQRHH